MNLENLLNNDNNKLLFLKAIMLGITYGSSDKKNYYIENIENEIKKINNKINVNNINNVNNNSFNNINSQKIEQKIIFLENQKKNILKFINQLSSNNYGFNYSRINILKSNLELINNEIDKNKLLIKKQNQNKNKNKNNNQNINQNNPINNKKENLVGELEKTLSNLSNLFI